MTAVCVFWACIALVAYAYAGYPLLTAMMAQRFGHRPAAGTALPAITVVVAAFNEHGRIADRIRDILAQDYPADQLRVLVVDDGSHDGTAQAADIGDPRVTVLSLPANRGKAAALNSALVQVATPLVVFTDVRQRFAAGALRALAVPFADPQVGAVSGELEIAPSASCEAPQIGLYWRMERRLRADEAMLGWLHGVTGAIYALRRELYRPIPAGTVLDDMWIPLQAIREGKRVWFTRAAVAHDAASGSHAEEFRRKLRTLAGNWQLLARIPWLANPFRNRVFFAWFSHKFLRLVVPWALLAALVASCFAPWPVYRVLFWLQMLAYAAALFALLWPRLAARLPLLPAAGTFLMLNAAALLSLPAALAWSPAKLWKSH